VDSYVDVSLLAMCYQAMCRYCVYATKRLKEDQSGKD